MSVTSKYFVVLQLTKATYSTVALLVAAPTNTNKLFDTRSISNQTGLFRKEFPLANKGLTTVQVQYSFRTRFEFIIIIVNSQPSYLAS